MLLSVYFKSTHVSCCLFVCSCYSSSLRCIFSSNSSTEVALFRFVKFQTLSRTLLPNAADQSGIICYNVVRYKDSNLCFCFIHTVRCYVSSFHLTWVETSPLMIGRGFVALASVSFVITALFNHFFLNGYSNSVLLLPGHSCSVQ